MAPRAFGVIFPKTRGEETSGVLAHLHDIRVDGGDQKVCGALAGARVVIIDEALICQITICETVMRFRGVGAFAGLRRDHPGVTVELYTGNADAVEERLERGLIDFALLLEPVNLDKYEWLRMPISDRVGVAVAADGPWAALDAATPSEIAEMPLLLSSRTSNKAVDLAAWSSGAIDVDNLNIVGRFDLIGNASYLVRSGAACAMGIDHLLQLDDASDLRFIPLDPPMEIASFLVWKKYRLRSRACEELLCRLRSER